MSMLDREMLALMRAVTDTVILPRFRNLAEGDIEQKAVNDPVTVADREAEVMLFEGLAKLDPSLGMVGEEAVHADPAVADLLAGPCWIVDPIDGTRNYASGQGPFGILIARAEAGEPVSGWIFDCLSGRFCAAHRGEGAAFVDGERIAVTPAPDEDPAGGRHIAAVRQRGRSGQAMVEHISPLLSASPISPTAAAEQYPAARRWG